MFGRSFRSPVLAGALLLALAAPALSQSRSTDSTSIDIPYQKFVLKNGLTLLVHEDHKAPIVAVNVWYHVGSKNEPAGHTGFAHLFEHLMFTGSENHPGVYDEALNRVGATELNGTTNEDRTNYFEDVPKTALDVALWMESDRMGHLLGAIDTTRLDVQRGVVQNEKRQDENAPYGMVDRLITENTYPAGHPYHHTVIGSMKDLDAASLEDVKSWFRKYYGAANAVLSIAGDVDPQEIKAEVEKYFGDVPPGPPVDHQQTWIAKMTGTHRQVVEDRVPQARIYEVWNIPEWGSTEATYLDLVSDVLSSGKSSRLYKRLVYDEQIATDVNAYVSLNEIGGQFVVRATAKPGEGLAKVESDLDEELARFLKDGPTEDELQRVKTQYRANFVRGIERVGGFGGTSDILARGEVFRGDPETYKKQLADVSGATAEELRDAAKKWLSDGVYVLEVHPYGDFEAGKSTVDRSKGVPEPGPPPTPHFPARQTATLSNGLKVIVARRDAVPVVHFDLQFDAGYASDALARPGTARLAMSTLTDGTDRYSALEISKRLQSLGAQLSAGSDLDASFVSLSALSENLDPSLDLFADVVLHPSFPAQDFTREKKQQLSSIEQEKSRPVALALRLLPGLLYGPEHAYGSPMTGSGTTESVQAIRRQDLVQFHDRWMVPNNATLVVVGPVTMEEIRPKLEKLFAGWRNGKVPSKSIGHVAEQTAPRVYLVDRPGAQQSMIIAGELAPPKANPNEAPIQVMNTVLGGSFTSRINMNLREDKHWAYGAATLLWPAKGQRPFIVYAPVQTDKTAESMEQVLDEFRAIRSQKPVTKAELSRAKNIETLTLPGRWETASAIVRDLSDVVEYGLPKDYWDSYPERVRSVTLAQANHEAQEIVRPDRLTWVVVGDLDKIEKPVRALRIGQVRIMSSDGKVQPSAE